MTLNSSGPISLGGCTSGISIAKELGLTTTATISFNDTVVRSLAGKTTAGSAVVSPTDFWGKSVGGGYIYGPGTWCFIPPTGVTKVSAVAVGGGGAGGTAQMYAFGYCGAGRTIAATAGQGGGAGALVYGNNISVTPGTSYSVIVGAGGVVGTVGSHGNKAANGGVDVSGWPSGSSGWYAYCVNVNGAGNRTMLCFGAGGKLLAGGGIAGNSNGGTNQYYIQYSCGCFSCYYPIQNPPGGGTYSSVTSWGGAWGGNGGKSCHNLSSNSGYSGFLPTYTTNTAGIPGGTYTTGNSYAGGGGGTGGFTGNGGTGGGSSSVNGSLEAAVAGLGGGGGGGRATTRTYTGAAGGGVEVYVNSCTDPTVKSGCAGAGATGGTLGGLNVSGTVYHGTSGGNSSNAAKPTPGKYGAGGAGGRCAYVSGNGTTWISGVSLSFYNSGGMRYFTFTNNQTACYAGNGGDGVARIIWAGDARSYPTTKTSNPNTTIYGTA